MERNRIFAQRVQADSRRLVEKARFLWNCFFSTAECKIALTQPLILETCNVGSGSHVSKWTERMWTQLSSMRAQWQLRKCVRLGMSMVDNQANLWIIALVAPAMDETQSLE